MAKVPSYSSLEAEDIVSKYSCFLLDAYGVFWGGLAAGAFPGSWQTMERLISSGKTIGILSNSTAQAQKEIDKYHKAGFIQGKHFHFLITSGEIAKNYFEQDRLPFLTPSKKYISLFPTHPVFGNAQSLFEKSTFKETDSLDEADFIYVSVPHLDGQDQTDIDLFRPYMQRFIKSKKPMVCANPDFYAHEGHPARLVIRQGSVAALYEEYGGQVLYIGKPARDTFEIALQKMNGFSKNAGKVLMVGDTPETDIRGAFAAGIDSALICATGIMGERIQAQGQKAWNDLPITDRPTLCIERFS